MTDRKAPSHALRERIRSYEQHGGVLRLWTLDMLTEQRMLAWDEEERHEDGNVS